MKKIMLIVSIFIAGCSSSPKSNDIATSETEPDRVLSRIDDMSDRPSWLKESEPFRVEGGYLISTGQTVIPSDHRVEAAYRICENNGKASISSAIESRLETVFQNAEEGTSMGSTQARYIGAEASKLTTSSLRLDHRYWERVATTTDGGQRVTQYKIFCTVKMPESDFKTAIMDAIRRQQGKGGLSRDFAEKVNRQWDAFTAPQSQPGPASVQPQDKSANNEGGE